MEMEKIVSYSKDFLSNLKNKFLNFISNINIRKFEYLYLLIFIFTMLVICCVMPPMPYGEWDDFSFPIASLLNDHNFSISKSDVQLMKDLFPSWARYVDDYSLSGYFAKNGGELAWYFPTYAILCLPVLFFLQIIKVNTIYTFPILNLFVYMISLLIVITKLKTEEKRKLILLILLTINPIVFYISWVSSEVPIFAFVIISLVHWYNREYKRAAFFISIAGTMNPTILAAGIIMIIEFFIFIFLKKDKEITLLEFVKRNIKRVIAFGCCFIIGIVPMIYNYINVGHISLTASLSNFTQGKETTFSRFIAYFFDLNFGILPYYPFLLFLGIVVFVISIKKKNILSISWIISFIFTVFMYSFMVHINCGMSGIARYSSWGVVLLIFPIVLFYNEIFTLPKLKKIYLGIIMTSTIITGSIVLSYNPYRASDTSYTKMTPIAKVVLDYFPEIYNPLPSTFNSRSNNVDGGYDYTTPIIYTNDDGYVRKIYADSSSKEYFISNYREMNGHNEWLKNKINSLGKKPSYISIPRKYKVVEAYEYTAGTQLVFLQDGYNIEKYVMKGIYSPEDWGSWTQGNVFILRFISTSECKKYGVHMYVGVYNEKQDVKIYVNNKVVFEEKDFPGWNIDFEIDNPGVGGIVDMKIKIPGAASPFASGNSDDLRVIGLAFRTIVFDPIS